MSLEAQLDEIRSVVQVVVDETPRTSQRVRLLAPWVDEVRRRGASWRQLVPVLAPICSLADDIKTETRLSQIFSVSAKRRPKSAVDFESWRGAVAEAAGVALPATARPVDNGSIVVPARLVGLLEKMAEGLRPAQRAAGQMSPGRGSSPVSAVPATQPSRLPAATSRPSEPAHGQFVLTAGRGDSPAPLDLRPADRKRAVSDAEARQMAEEALRASENNKIAERKAAMEARMTGFLTSSTTSSMEKE